MPDDDDFEEIEFDVDEEMPDPNFDDSDFVITDEFNMDEFPDFEDFDSFGEEDEY